MPAEKRTEGFGSRLKRAANADSFAGASNAVYGGVVDQYGGAFDSLEPALQRANMGVLFRTYISEMLMAITLAAFMGLSFAVMIGSTLGLPPMAIVAIAIAFPLLTGMIVFGIMYLYPSWKAGKRAADINRNLPFALNHMSAVAGSGVPPSSMFELLVNFEEYGEISAESEKIVTRVRAFGEDVTTAIRDVARNTPSDDLQEILYGIVATVETGGSLSDFLDERADRALFDYKIKREKEIQRLTTFASFYTAVLVAAPLFLVTILAVLELVGGNIFGFPIKSSCGILGSLQGECPIGVIDIGAYFAIPTLNILFIIAMEVFQPEI